MHTESSAASVELHLELPSCISEHRDECIMHVSRHPMLLIAATVR